MSGGGSDLVRFTMRLTRYYEMYAPEKVSTVPAMVEKYAGAENALFNALEKKYGPEKPIAPTSAQPKEVPATATASSSSTPPVEPSQQLAPSNSPIGIPSQAAAAVAAPPLVAQDERTSTQQRMDATATARAAPAPQSNVDPAPIPTESAPALERQRAMSRGAAAPAGDTGTATSQAPPPAPQQPQASPRKGGKSVGFASVDKAATGSHESNQAAASASSATSTAQPSPPTPATAAPQQWVNAERNATREEPLSSSSTTAAGEKGGGAAPAAIDPAQRERLAKFYRKYAPEKLGNVDAALRSYAGREKLMWELLINKYGPEGGDDDDSAGHGGQRAKQPEQTTVIKPLPPDRGDGGAAAGNAPSRQDIPHPTSTTTTTMVVQPAAVPPPLPSLAALSASLATASPAAAAAASTNVPPVSPPAIKPAVSVTAISAAPPPPPPFDHLEAFARRARHITTNLTSVFGPGKERAAAALLLILNDCDPNALFDATLPTIPIPISGRQPSELDRFVFERILDHRFVWIQSWFQGLVIRQEEVASRRAMLQAFEVGKHGIIYRHLVLTQAIQLVSPTEIQHREAVEAEEAIVFEGLVSWFRRRRDELLYESVMRLREGGNSSHESAVRGRQSDDVLPSRLSSPPGRRNGGGAGKDNNDDIAPQYFSPSAPPSRRFANKTFQPVIHHPTAAEPHHDEEMDMMEGISNAERPGGSGARAVGGSDYSTSALLAHEASLARRYMIAAQLHRVSEAAGEPLQVGYQKNSATDDGRHQVTPDRRVAGRSTSANRPPPAIGIDRTRSPYLSGRATVPGTRTTSPGPSSVPASRRVPPPNAAGGVLGGIGGGQGPVTHGSCRRDALISGLARQVAGAPGTFSSRASLGFVQSALPVSGSRPGAITPSSRGRSRF